MPQTEESAAKKPTKSLYTNWPLLRKLETLVFACMLALLPVFALKVVNVTTTQLAVMNTCADLRQYLTRAKNLAKENNVNITVSSRRASSIDSAAYLIQDDHRTIEEVVLPLGVVVDGTVKFDGEGNPTEAATFTISKGSKTAKILIDENGVISLRERPDLDH